MALYFKLAVSKEERKTQIEMVDAALEYIFDSELEDFAENPSNMHVYYKAYAAAHGIKDADEMLAEAINDLAKVV